MSSVRFHEAATEAAVRWYNERLVGLGDDFRVELLGAVNRIVRAPLLWPPTAYDRRARRFLLPRFPYGVVYVVAADASIVVVAVAHARRRPRYWVTRSEMPRCPTYRRARVPMPEDILNEEEAERLADNKPIVSELYLRYATIAYARRIEFQPWEHYAFACLARAHCALDSIFLLNGREADSAALTRVLYEHIVAFAWLMIDPPAHYLALLSWEQRERQKMRSDIADFASTPGPTSDEITLFMIADGLDQTVPPARATPDRALAADAHWSRLVPDWSFRRLSGSPLARSARSS